LDKDDTLASIMIFKLMMNSKRWEDRLGAMCGAQALVSNKHAEEFLWSFILKDKLKLLSEDEEFKVRNHMGPLLKTILESNAEKAADHMKGLFEHFSWICRSALTKEDSEGKPDESWKRIETGMRTLQNLFIAYGTDATDLNLDELFEVMA
jgi:hypothetical protein